jgi:hypothetical protein
MRFDERHARFRWFPWAIALCFILVSGVALTFNFGNPLVGLSGYLLGLVVVDVGFAAIVVLAWLMGRRLWREDQDPRYLAASIGFAGLPIWTGVQTVCITYVFPALSLSDACLLMPSLAWVAVLWLLALPVAGVFADFYAFLGGGLPPIEAPRP